MNDILDRLSGSKKPLIICDIDEVVMEFLDPFQAYLASVEHRLHADSFRLHGNIRRTADGVCATREEVEAFQEAFYSSQDKWQTPVVGASDVLASSASVSRSIS